MSEATLPPEEAQMWLRLGLRAARAGDRVEAKRYFQWAREAAPQNVMALLWLAGLANDRGEAMALFSRVLELDPGNEHALAGIRWARQEDQFAAVTSLASVAAELAEEAAEVPTYRRTGQAVPPPPPPKRHAWLFWLLLGAVLTSALLVVSAWLALNRPPGGVPSTPLPTELRTPTGSASPAVAASPVATATSTLAATRTLAPGPSTTHTSTPTVMSTPGASPTTRVATRTPAPSPSTTHTGMPTATSTPGASPTTRVTTPTQVSMPSATHTGTPIVTSTPGASPTRPRERTREPTRTPIPTPLPLTTPTGTGVLVATPSPSPIATPTSTPAPSATRIPTQPLPTVTPYPATSEAGSAKWIDVNLTTQRLVAYEGLVAVNSAPVSTGLPGAPTVTGTFGIYWKLAVADMIGPGYHLTGVPYTMYFFRGYALHGTYWHDSFGQPMIHGCVSLRTEDAEWLFNWSDPPLPEGSNQVRASHDSPGTQVVLHY